MTWTNILIFILILCTFTNITVSLATFGIIDKTREILAKNQKIEDSKIAAHREKIEYLKKQLGGE